ARFSTAYLDDGLDFLIHRCNEFEARYPGKFCWSGNIDGELTFASTDEYFEQRYRINYGSRSEVEGRINVCLLEDDAELIANLEGVRFSQDPDVLDTWFSSQLWPHSTFGWPDETPELRYYYPTSTLVTSRDIITLWVARMVLSGLYNMGDVPFRDVYITPKLLDGFGEGMSKSKGNGVDPLDIIDRYGADALRYQMVFMSGETQDSRLPVANVCPHCDTLV